jgi:hypothetical protein
VVLSRVHQSAAAGLSELQPGLHGHMARVAAAHSYPVKHLVCIRRL